MNAKPNSNIPRHSDMLIKVCGNRNADNIRCVASLTPMLMGFIFVASSPRNAIGLDPVVIRNLPSYIRPVAVFVDADINTILKTCDEYGFRIVQLHGHESPGMCASLRKKGLVVFKALGLAGATNWMALATYCNSVDMFILDSHSGNKGGSGQKFDWTVLNSYPFSTPFMLSGGIGPDDIDAITSAMRPAMAGIDINSRFEKEPGIKDINLLSQFILELRKYNEDEQTPVPFWEKD